MQEQNGAVGESTQANSKHSEQSQDMRGISQEEIKQWEEARCPVCLEHPHNAVLLRCSSFKEGCRSFMCNTSSHHSNCLDQFRNSLEPSPSSFMMPFSQQTQEDGESEHMPACPEYMLACPLCRGRVYGWFVVEPAREFMNSKTRTCSTETCEFIGNYVELREHARSEHPSIHPSDVDPERQQNWTRLENADLPSQEDSILDDIGTEVHNNIGIFVYIGPIILTADLLGFTQRNYNNYYNSRQNDIDTGFNSVVNYNDVSSSRNNYSFRERILGRNRNDRQNNNFNRNLDLRQTINLRGNIERRMQDTQRRRNNTRQNNNRNINGYDTRRNHSRS